MKVLIKIAIYLLILLVLTAEDCGGPAIEPSKADTQASLFQEVENEFVKDELSEHTLMAFEKRAEQKIRDLIDLVDISGDTSISRPFKIQAEKMIEEMFISQTSLKKYYHKLNLTEAENKGIESQSEGDPFRTSIESLKKAGSFQQYSSEKYVSTISFTQLVTSFHSDRPVSENVYQLILQIEAVKQSKFFGEEELEVWELFFSIPE